MQRPEVTGFFDQATSSITYVVADPASRQCAVVDAVLDYDGRRGHTSTVGTDTVIGFVRERALSVAWVLETHVHADHMTAARHVKAALGGRIGIGAAVTKVQRTFRDIYNLPDLEPDGRHYDHLFADGETFAIGGIPGHVLAAPGHTPACVAYHVGDALFVGDTMLMPDFGTARCDFPGGDAATLYRSVQRLLELPSETRVFVGHDYGPNGRPIAWETTIAAQRAGNLHMRDGIDQAAFVEMRTARDKTLELPALMLPALQVNVRGGALPEAEANGVRYLKIPVDRF